MASSDPTDIPSGAPAERVDELYGLPLDEFTPRRDALAKELRQDGRREEANWVKALKRPSAAAWLVNQLARSQPRDAQRLLKADEALRKANARVLSGKGKATELARAGEEHSGAIRDLMSKAPGLLDTRGRSPSAATLEKVEETLRSLALDDEVRGRFELGRLTAEARATGFGAFEGALPARSGREPSPEPRAPSFELRAKAREALREAKAELSERKRAVADAERGVREATRAAEKAQRALEGAEEALAKARAAEDAAAARVSAAEADAG